MGSCPAGADNKPGRRLCITSREHAGEARQKKAKRWGISKNFGMGGCEVHCRLPLRWLVQPGFV